MPKHTEEGGGCSLQNPGLVTVRGSPIEDLICFYTFYRKDQQTSSIAKSKIYFKSGNYLKNVENVNCEKCKECKKCKKC